MALDWAPKNEPTAQTIQLGRHVRDIATDDDDRAIVMAVISLGHRMNRKVPAEGVETAEQVAFLRRNDCDAIQRFHVGPPMPAHRGCKRGYRHRPDRTLQRPQYRSEPTCQ